MDRNRNPTLPVRRKTFPPRDLSKSYANRFPSKAFSPRPQTAVARKCKKRQPIETSRLLSSCQTVSVRGITLWPRKVEGRRWAFSAVGSNKNSGRDESSATWKTLLQMFRLMWRIRPLCLGIITIGYLNTIAKERDKNAEILEAVIRVGKLAEYSRSQIVFHPEAMKEGMVRLWFPHTRVGV